MINPPLRKQTKDSMTWVIANLGGTSNASKYTINGIKPTYTKSPNIRILDYGKNYIPNATKRLKTNAGLFAKNHAYADGDGDTQSFSYYGAYFNYAPLRIYMNSPWAYGGRIQSPPNPNEYYDLHNPVYLDYGNTYSVDPSEEYDPDCLTVFYDDVTNESGEIEDFSVTFTVSPDDASVRWHMRNDFQVSFTDWSIAEKPEGSTAELEQVSENTVKLKNINIGGMYTVQCQIGDTVTTAKVLCPLAGAEMIDWVDKKAKDMMRFFDDYFGELNLKQIPQNAIFLGNGINNVILFAKISKQYFFVFDPVDRMRCSPSLAYKSLNSERNTYSGVTLNGVVIDGSKLANIFWGMFAAYCGWQYDMACEGANIAEFVQTLMKHRRIGFDSRTAQNSYRLGFELFSALRLNPNLQVQEVLKRKKLTDVQAGIDEGMIDSLLWPSSYEYESDYSTFKGPIIPLSVIGSETILLFDDEYPNNS